LAPGESTVVELIFKTRNYKTKIRKYATIYSNDPDQPTAKIHMSADVYPEPDSTLPFSLSIDKVSLSEDNKKGEIILENKGDSKLYVESAGEIIDGLKIDVKNDDPKPGQKSKLKFEWENEFEKENTERSLTFMVYGSGKDTTRFSVPVFLQGTDPTPPRVTRTQRKSTGTSKNVKPRTVRRPARRSTTSSDDPRIVKPERIEKPQTAAESKESLILKKKTPEDRSDNSAEAADIESEDNQ
jgi:hypothetical protein